MTEVPITEAAAPEAAEVSPAEGTEEQRPAKTSEQYEEELAKVRREAHNLRSRLKEAEPLAKKAQEADEAAKTDMQKALDRAQAAEQALLERDTNLAQMELAIQYHLEPDDIELIGSGSREEMEVRAKRVAAKNAAASKASPPPPSERPVENLRPGASPEPSAEADDSYPQDWKPKSFLRDSEARIIYGQ